MKVLHLSSESTWRGGEQQIIYLVEETRKLGVDAIIGCRENSEVEKYCKNNQLPFVSLPFKSAYDISTAFRIVKYCRNEKIQLVQTHTSKSHTMSVIAGLFGLNIPQILTRRVDFPIKNNWFSRFKYNYSKIKRIICISETINKMTAVDIKEKSKLITIHSGVDINKFSPYFTSDWLRLNFKIKKDTVVIGNTSAISDQKDYFTFVKAAQRLINQKKDVHFFIVGDGPTRPAIEQFVKEKELVDHITFTGFVDNINELLPALDIFLFTSKTEGLGTSVLDAMAANVPIVATAAGGVPEMVEHEKNGLLYQVGDVEGITEGVERFLADRELAKSLADEAQKTVKNFSKEKTARRTLKVYNEIV
ncbi:MAG: glycosyltransferase family 4 protein [Cytophagales bacterium]|nr:glycosyltransferase family 4 protein [Cytophagales bacterium]